ncbi:hypothetical protein niasHT_024073 [Heterodera trifolii]|uniref:G-protein coupled receptors family 1 profile domain-containing protein n=1 Tax=Heterodera trifolii TaxID=157864 RepID=A0ABD2JYQ2_9BILA
MNSTVDHYTYYRTTGQLANNLFSGFVVRWIISCFGILLSSFLIYATIITRQVELFQNSLHGICNKLIAFDSAATILYQLGTFVGAFLMLTGIYFVPLPICCHFLQSLPLVGIYCSSITILFLAIERILMIVFPIWYQYRKTRKIFLLLFLTCTTFSLLVLQSVFRWVQDETGIT